MNQTEVMQIQRRCQIETLAAMITSEYVFSAMRLIKATKNMYWFQKYEVKIGIPREYLDERLKDAISGKEPG